MNTSRILSLIIILFITLVSAGVVFLEMEKDDMSGMIDIQYKRLESSALANTVKPDFNLQTYLDFINAEQSQFYPNDIDDRIFSLGQEISQLILTHDLKIIYYSINENNQRKYFHYSISGKMKNCMAMIQTLSNGDLYFRFNTIQIESSTDQITMNLVFTPAIIYESIAPDDGFVIPDETYDAILPELISTRLFFAKTLINSVNKVPESTEPVKMEEVIPNGPIWLSYIGYSVENGLDKYYFLDNRTNKTIEISAESENNFFEIIKTTSTGFIILLNGETYYARK